ncbi:MAG: metallophosphoesterase family protein [Caulobacterales bacterium]
MGANAVTVTPAGASPRIIADLVAGMEPPGTVRALNLPLAAARRWSFCALLAAVALGAAACGPSAQSDAPAPAQSPPDPAFREAWVQLTGRGAEMRAITAAATCPTALIDGQAATWETRSAPSPDFPLTVCQALLPAGTKAAAVEGRALPLSKVRPQRILIFGDTGCRLKGADVQACDNPAEWPFALVARLAAAHQPDLVIHVGDYYYRETPCPAGRQGCAASPYGDNWWSWNADFFQPAAPLLAAAPWVMVRGNHEDCRRGGPIWFKVLDAGVTPLACPAVAAPYAVDIGGLALYVIDSADAEDNSAPPQKVAVMTAELDALKTPLKTQPGWILTHRPIWGLATVASPIGTIEAPLDATEQAAVRGRDLSAVQMIVSGHIHHFASFDFGQARPAQLIAGTGGDVGDEGDSPKLRATAARIDGMSARAFTFNRYGFLILERSGEAWTGAFYDMSDHVIARCRLAGRSLACGPA